MESEIITYLQQEFEAEAIALHGSRSRGTEHPSSDWDLLVFTKSKTVFSQGIIFQKQDLDIKVIHLPFTNIQEFINAYPQSTQSFRILLDTANKILKRIQSSVLKQQISEPGITDTRKKYIQDHFRRMINRLENSQPDAVLFQYHLASFYTKSINYYFEYQGKRTQPIRVALEIIKKESPLFSSSLEKIAKQPTTCTSVIENARNIQKEILTSHDI